MIPESKKRLNIVFTVILGFGGGVMSMHYICEGLGSLGHNVTCIFIRNKKGKTPPFSFIPKNYKTIFIDAPFGSYAFVCYKFIKQFSKNHPINVIISFGPEGSLLKSICKQRNIVRIASYHHPNPTYVGLKDLLRFKYLNPGNIGKWMHAANIYLSRKSLQDADKIHCLSEYQKAQTVEKLHISEKKIEVVYLGVDTQKFYAKTDYSKKVGKIIYCGGFVESKGIVTLLKAFSLVVKNNPTIVLNILGDGDPHHYKKVISDLRIQDQVVYRGYIPYKDIDGYYRDADIFVAPTKHESFGLGIVEAMASSLPVVASNVTAIPEIIQNSVSGLLFSVGDEYELAKELEVLIGNSQKVREIGLAARERTENRFTWNATVTSLEKLIFETLSKNNQHD
jgi:glycosyltransferase involved in cell wall biosynthesis